MTLILAARNEEGIYVASDMLRITYLIMESFWDESSFEVKDYVYKTRTFWSEEGVGILGAAGWFEDSSKFLRGFANSLQDIENLQEGTITDLIKNPFLGERLGEDIESKSLILGFYDKGTPKLVSYNSSAARGVVETGFVGIGDCYSEGVDRLIQTNYHPELDELNLLFLLKEGMSLAKEEANCKLEGLFVEKIWERGHQVFFEDLTWGR
jgi:hypothetical protein